MGATAFGDAFWAGGRSRKIKARIVVEGDLILLTPAHFGNGDGSDETDLPLLADALEPTRPLLTGASLAGALRAYLRRISSKDASLDKALFGGAKGDDAGEQSPSDAGEQSPLIVDDALGQAAGVELRDGVKLDPTTRTAAEGALFNVETWAAGTTFNLRLELALNGDSSARLRALAAALTGLSNGSITLGMRKQRGYGKVSVEQWRVRRYELAGSVRDLLDWLKDGNRPLPEDGPGVSLVPARDRDDGALMADLLKAFGAPDAQALPLRQNALVLTAQFALPGSILIRGNTGRDDLGPDMVHLHSRRDGRLKPIVSGTSLAGALRARATRILNTLNPDKTQPIIAEMFGPEMKGKVTPKASRVIVEECEVVNAVTELVQNRIRIDRFTGGVVEGGLFSEQPAFGKPDTRLTIRLRLLDPKDHEIGLLLLLLKDLWTGDLPLGGEISVGRGRLRGRSATLSWKCAEKTKEWRIERDGDDPNDSHLKISGDQARLEAFVSEHLRRELFGAEVLSSA